MTTLRASSGRRLAALLVLVAFLIGLTMTRPAHAADSVSNAITALQSNPVYVDPSAEGADKVDVAQVKNAISGTNVLVAVLPASAGNATESPSDIGKGVGGRHTVIALVGQKLAADSNELGSQGGGVEQKAVQAEADHHSGGF